MIILDKEMAFISFYLAEKEYFLPDNLRNALSYIYYLTHEKGKDKALAVHITNEKYKKVFNIDYNKKFLWKMYNTRLAHIKNGKDKYKKWTLDLRERNAGLKLKLCDCGCGEEVKKEKYRFIHGHNIRTRSKEQKQYYAKLMLDKRPKKHEKKKVIKVDFKSLHNST